MCQTLLWNTIPTHMCIFCVMYSQAVDLEPVPYVPRQFKDVLTGRHVNHRRVLKREGIHLVLVKSAAGAADEVRAAVTLMAADRTMVTSMATDNDQNQAAATAEGTDTAEVAEFISVSRCSSRDLS